MARGDSVSFKNRDRVVEIGLNIARCRKRDGMTQAELAEKAGISRQYMGEIESRFTVANVTIEVLLNIADALGIGVDRFFDFRDIE